MISSFSSVVGKRNCASFFTKKHHHTAHHSDEPKLYTCSCASDTDYDYVNDPDNVADIPSVRVAAVSPEPETSGRSDRSRAFSQRSHSPKHHRRSGTMNCLQTLVRRSSSESNLSVLSLVSSCSPQQRLIIWFLELQVYPPNDSKNIDVILLCRS